MTVAYIECAAGASGDMFLGAWLDLALAQDVWLEHLASLPVQGYEIAVERVMKSGIAATKVTVLAQHSHHHRHLPDIVGPREHSPVERNAGDCRLPSTSL